MKKKKRYYTEKDFKKDLRVEVDRALKYEKKYKIPSTRKRIYQHFKAMLVRPADANKATELFMKLRTKKRAKHKESR